MLQTFILQIQEQYPTAYLIDRIPATSSYRIAYADHLTWRIGTNWCSLQWHDAKHIFLYCIEVEAHEDLYFPTTIVKTDIHWQYALQGGYQLVGSDGPIPVLEQRQQHKLMGNCGSFVVTVAPGRHLTIGFNIAAQWLVRYHDELHISPEDFAIPLLRDRLYQSEPAPITEMMLSELLFLLGLPKSGHLHQDASIYGPISRLLSLQLKQEEESNKTETKPSCDKVNAIHHYISERLTNNQPIIPVYELSSYFEISSDYLNRVHKEMTGSSIKTYINDKTLERATQLLSLAYSVSEVSYLLGYSDIAAFSKAFKKKYGMAPRQHTMN